MGWTLATCCAQDVCGHVPAYVPLLAPDLDVLRHVAAYVPLLALDRDVLRHVAAYDRFLALDRDVLRHVPAYVPLPPARRARGRPRPTLTGRPHEVLNRGATF